MRHAPGVAAEIPRRSLAKAPEKGSPPVPTEKAVCHNSCWENAPNTTDSATGSNSAWTRRCAQSKACGTREVRTGRAATCERGPAETATVVTPADEMGQP